MPSVIFGRELLVTAAISLRTVPWHGVQEFYDNESKYFSLHGQFLRHL
ncbi:hypothetical protein [Xylocopilactobacillus apis]|nr:hypothetical protein [Xylocopilactobacillus apis]